MNKKLNYNFKTEEELRELIDKVFADIWLQCGEAFDKALTKEIEKYGIKV